MQKNFRGNPTADAFKKRNVRKNPKNEKPFRLFAGSSRHICCIVCVNKLCAKQTHIADGRNPQNVRLCANNNITYPAGAGAFYTTWRVSSDKFAVCLNNPVSGAISATPVIARLCVHTYFSRFAKYVQRSSDVSGRRFDTLRRYYSIYYVGIPNLYTQEGRSDALYGELQRWGGGQSRFERAKWRDQRGEQTSLTVYIVGTHYTHIYMYERA